MKKAELARRRFQGPSQKGLWDDSSKVIEIIGIIPPIIKQSNFQASNMWDPSIVGLSDDSTLGIWGANLFVGCWEVPGKIGVTGPSLTSQGLKDQLVKTIEGISNMFNIGIAAGSIGYHIDLL